MVEEIMLHHSGELIYMRSTLFLQAGAHIKSVSLGFDQELILGLNGKYEGVTLAAVAAPHDELLAAFRELMEKGEAR